MSAGIERFRAAYPETIQKVSNETIQRKWMYMLVAFSYGVYHGVRNGQQEVKSFLETPQGQQRLKVADRSIHDIVVREVDSWDIRKWDMRKIAAQLSTGDVYFEIFFKSRAWPCLDIQQTPKHVLERCEHRTELT